MSESISLDEVKNWQERLSQLFEINTVMIAISQTGKEWSEKQRLPLRDSIERELAKLALAHPGQIKIVRLIGVPEGSVREKWIRMHSSWATFAQERVVAYHLFSPEAAASSALQIFDEGEEVAFEKELEKIKELSDGNIVKIHEFASLTSFRDRYPVTGSL